MKRQRDGEPGELPPLLAAAEAADWERVHELLRTDPTAAQQRVALPQGTQDRLNLRALPLHKALYKSAPLPVIEALVEAYPDALKYMDEAGWMPVHLAAEIYWSDVVPRYLLLAEGTEVVDRRAEDDVGMRRVYALAKSEVRRRCLRARRSSHDIARPRGSWTIRNPSFSAVLSLPL
eukprot:5176980-Prymnesium_polylepis.2